MAPRPCTVSPADLNPTTPSCHTPCDSCNQATCLNCPCCPSLHTRALIPSTLRDRCRYGTSAPFALIGAFTVASLEREGNATAQLPPLPAMLAARVAALSLCVYRVQFEDSSVPTRAVPRLEKGFGALVQIDRFSSQVLLHAPVLLRAT